MLGYGTALKMLLLPPELLPTAFSRDDIVALFNTLSSFSSALEYATPLYFHVAFPPLHTSLGVTWHALLTTLPLVTRGASSSPHRPWRHVVHPPHPTSLGDTWRILLTPPPLVTRVTDTSRR